MENNCVFFSNILVRTDKDMGKSFRSPDTRGVKLIAT